MKKRRRDRLTVFILASILLHFRWNGGGIRNLTSFMDRGGRRHLFHPLQHELFVRDSINVDDQHRAEHHV
jgi:hypothetical protein